MKTAVVEVYSHNDGVILRKRISVPDLDAYRQAIWQGLVSGREFVLIEDSLICRNIIKMVTVKAK
jgi:hypothetical protein